MCQFDGIAPEMVKVRPAIILARNRQNNQLVTVVPISTTAPKPAMPYHHQLTVNPVPPKPGQPGQRQAARPPSDNYLGRSAGVIVAG